MSKILFGMLIAWLVTSCSIEEPNNSGVLVDPNSDTEVPEGLTARDFDHNNDKVVDILDLVIASKFFGQEVKECPIGQHENSLGECVDCPQLTNKKGNRDYLPIKLADYVRSDDPTECKIGEEVDKQYLFPHPNGDYFYTYALLTIAKKTNFIGRMPTTNTEEFKDMNGGNDKSVEKGICRGYVCEKDHEGIFRVKETQVKVAVRLLFSQVSFSRIKELKVKAVDPSEFDTVSFEFEPIPKYSRDAASGKQYIKKRNREEGFIAVVSAVNENWPKEDALPDYYKEFLPKILLLGINIGHPSELVEDKSDTMVTRINFNAPPSFHHYAFGNDKLDRHLPYLVHTDLEWMFPEEVRAKYFPEDIDD